MQLIQAIDQHIEAINYGPAVDGRVPASSSLWLKQYTDHNFVFSARYSDASAAARLAAEAELRQAACAVLGLASELDAVPDEELALMIETAISDAADLNVGFMPEEQLFILSEFKYKGLVLASQGRILDDTGDNLEIAQVLQEFQQELLAKVRALSRWHQIAVQGGNHRTRIFGIGDTSLRIHLKSLP